jgi:hypothetical protein
MSRQSQQITVIIATLIRSTRGRLPRFWLVALVVLVGGYLVLEPALESRLGFDLPGVSTPPETIATGPTASPPARQLPTDQPPAPPSNSRTRAASGRSPTETVVDEVAIERVLSQGGQTVFVSPQGLRYTRGSVHGHRLKHLMAHTRDEPNRPGSHGVFAVESATAAVALVDEAYALAKQTTRTRVQEQQGRTVYKVDLERAIGYVGGETGARQGHPTTRYLQLVVEADDRGPRFITAYPISQW